MSTLTMEAEEQLIDPSRIPSHVAIIMDGNRRWAKQKGLPCMLGHWKGAEMLPQIVRSASNLGISILTVFAFSTENWGRRIDEVLALMHLIKSYLTTQKEVMIREGVKLSSIGDLSKLPQDLRELLKECEEATAHGNKIELILALNYGGRDDIRRATVQLAEDCKNGKVEVNAITEELFSSYLDTAKWKDPDLLIRTSGEQRLSNFLLWQISYAEVYITDVLWPDFDEKELLHAIASYQTRERRLGKDESVSRSE